MNFYLDCMINSSIQLSSLYSSINPSYFLIKHFDLHTIELMHFKAMYTTELSNHSQGIEGLPPPQRSPHAFQS